jgi:hypothetical protein
MKETVVGLRNPLAGNVVRKMAIVADGNVPMARVLP